LFVGDAGSLGIKARTSLRLIPRPRATGYASAAYGSAPAMLAAMAEVSRRALASECFGFDPVLAGMRLARASLTGDAKTLGAVVRRQGLVEGLKLVAAGRDLVGPNEWSVHVVVEADSPGALSGRLAEARRVLADAGGRAVEASIPKVLRSLPFTPPNSILGPAGERWVPVHGVLPHSAAAAAWHAVQDMFDDCADERMRLGVSIGWLCTTVAQQATLLEPVFYWPDAHTAYHRRVVEPGFLARVAGGDAANPAARALVARLKRAASDRLRAHGAAHFQIGRWYRWRDGRDPLALALHDAIKRELDPSGILNPGVLG
jgi:FAD/FMN-containing dehydrogenase